MNWIAGKIMGYLVLKEGMAAEIEENTHNGTRMVLVDSMGYRYELFIKMVGRNYIEPDENDRNS